jgi:hypothetical protein
MSEVRGQKTDDRRQKSDVRNQNLPAEAASSQAGTENRSQKAELKGTPYLSDI